VAFLHGSCLAHRLVATTRSEAFVPAVFPRARVIEAGPHVPPSRECLVLLVFVEVVVVADAVRRFATDA
jgi:hypothetical protein